MSRLAMTKVLLELRPEPLVRGSDLPGDVAGHLRGEGEQDPNRVVRPLLQAVSIRCLAVFEGIAADVVERVTVAQLGLPEGVVLLRRGQQFQFSGDDLLHNVLSPSEMRSSCQRIHNLYVATRSGVTRCFPILSTKSEVE